MNAITVSGSAKSNRLRESHFKKCDLANTPFVTVDVARKYAQVTFDMITTDRRLDHKTIHAVRDLFLSANVEGEVRFGDLHCMAPKVRREDAERVAQEAIKIVASAWETLPLMVSSAPATPA